MANGAVFDLLIIWADGKTQKVVHGVSDYRCDREYGNFVYVKNGYQSFVPVNSVRFFGRLFDYE